jgi:hypothetical protein
MGSGCLEQVAQAIHALLVVFGRQLAALEHAEQPLDGADGDARREVELVALQVLDDVFLAELVVVVGRAVLVELFLGLAAQVAPVHQKQHAPGAGELDQAVDEADGGEGLAAAGGHLDQGAGLVGLERVLQVADGDDLRGPQAGFDERRQGLQAGEEGGGWLLHRLRQPSGCGRCRRRIDQPLRQGLGPVEGKHGAGAGLRVQAVGEVGFDAGGFKTERQGPTPGGQRSRQALGVAGGLHFHAGEGGALFLGLDHAGGFGVDVEQVVGKAVAGVQREIRGSPRHGRRGCWRPPRCRHASRPQQEARRWTVSPWPPVSCVCPPFAAHSRGAKGLAGGAQCRKARGDGAE